MAELVYPPVVLACKTMFRVLDINIRSTGSGNIPRSGGAVIACNHVSYLDFVFCGLGALPASRYVRFMAKQQIFDHAIAGPLMRGMHHIPVDRAAGKASYDDAVARLRSGQVVGVFPEATISRSFTVKGLKSGAVRMAADAGVPLIPMAVWGTQRLWTKDRPRQLTQRHVPVEIHTGPARHIGPEADRDAETTELRARLQELLDQAQAVYPDTGADGNQPWWLPAHRGGSAPTPEQAAELDHDRPE